uniref:Uncharacterized protein n=1 Tax=Astyanax mexicanus TaxID=7994 RepID=A0A3B1JMN2_ASTMX
MCLFSMLFYYFVCYTLDYKNTVQSKNVPLLIKNKSTNTFLLGGLKIDADNNVGIRDQEMASMRQGRAFLTHLNDNIPKTVPAMEELLVTLEGKDHSFSQPRFETLIFGIVYSAYQVQKQEAEREEAQQKAWADVLGRLANVTFIQLRSY